jgi:hypothetical protein
LYAWEYVTFKEQCGIVATSSGLGATLLPANPALQLPSADPKKQSHYHRHVSICKHKEVGKGGSSAAEATAGQWVS